MSLLGRKKDNSSTDADVDASDAVEIPALEDAQQQAVGTAPKGRPTPKRDAARKRGPVAPAPLTSAEARKRRKELKGPKLSKEERKAEKLERRADMADRRERMMSGDDRYLLPRDKGPVRRYVRDIVDARRNFLGLFMPIALGMVFLMLSVGSVPAQQSLVMQLISSWGLMALLFVMLIDAVILGRKVNKLVDAKFPDHTERGFRLGLYAASRASQLRRMRAPRPQVERGAEVG